MATKKTSTKFDTAHNIETEADLTNKTATVKNLVTGETYAGGGESLPDISAGDAGKVLTVSDQLAAEWAAPKSAPADAIITIEGTSITDFTTATLTSGSYSDLLTKITANIFPNIIAIISSVNLTMICNATAVWYNSGDNIVGLNLILGDSQASLIINQNNEVFPD